MKLALGVNADSEVTGFRFAAFETPGLGAKWQVGAAHQFIGKSTTDDFLVGKDVQAISGATISSRSVAGGIKLVAAIEEIRPDQVVIDLVDP